MNEALVTDDLPGADLVKAGLTDLRQRTVSESALLLLVAGPNLRGLGLEIPDLHFSRPYHHLLYERLEDRLGADAYSYYNSLIRRIVSFAHALERRQSTQREPGATGGKF
jgi:hypothetical protein